MTPTSPAAAASVAARSGGTGRGGCGGASGKSAAQVTGPTTPSTFSGVPFASGKRAWKSLTAAAVRVSKAPLAGIGPQPTSFSRRWISRTRVAFFSPAFTFRPGKGRALT